MQKRKFDELISHFNRKVSDMSIDQKYKMELLGMISAIGFAHEKELSTNLASLGTDCISRQAAIETAKKMYVACDTNSIDDYEMLMEEALKVLPSALSTNLAEVGTDCISRQAAIDAAIEAADDWDGGCNIGRQKRIEKYIRQLPPIQPKRGKWIEDKGQQTLMQNFIEKGEVWRVCSVCGAGHMIGHKYECDKAYHETYHNFCPNCGADMRGEQDE